MRLSNVDWTDGDGELQPGTSFPAGVEMPIAWDFAATGDVYVQWQDGAGNWSPRSRCTSPSATVTLAHPTSRPRTLAYRFAYGLRSVGYPEIQVRDASKNGTPVCIDAFTVLR